MNQAFYLFYKIEVFSNHHQYYTCHDFVNEVLCERQFLLMCSRVAAMFLESHRKSRPDLRAHISNNHLSRNTSLIIINNNHDKWSIGGCLKLPLFRKRNMKFIAPSLLQPVHVCARVGLPPC